MRVFADKIINYFYLYTYNLCLDYRKGGFNKKQPPFKHDSAPTVDSLASFKMLASSGVTPVTSEHIQLCFMQSFDL